MAKPVFAKGDRVVLLRDAYGETDDGDEVVLPVGAKGVVSGVRECGKPDGPQGPWLYDVDFDTPKGNVWLIYDASDVGDLSRDPAVQPTAPEGGVA